MWWVSSGLPVIRVQPAFGSIFGMSKRETVQGFWSYFLLVVLKPWIGFWIAGTVMGIIYALTWLRDNTFSEEMQKKYATQKFLPQWE